MDAQETITGTVRAALNGTGRGIAAETVIEAQLRADLDALRAEHNTLKAEFSAELNRLSASLSVASDRLRKDIDIARDRVATLESRWYDRLHRWIQKVLACL
jgi:membrane-bound ClpP family serine protease